MRSPYLPSLPARYNNNFAFSNARQTVNSLLNVLERRTNRDRLFSYPPVIQVEVTKRCNMNCFMCLRGEVSKKDMAPEVAGKLIPISRWAGEMKLFGYGEPLISGAFYALLPRLDCGRITFLTNGKALVPRLFHKIMTETKRPIYSIAFSIDGASPKTYEGIRQGGDFHRVTKNLSYIDTYRKARGVVLPRTEISCVVMKKNIRELPDLVRLAVRLGVTYIVVAHLIVWEACNQDESLLYAQEATRRYFAEARETAFSGNVTLDLPAIITTVPEGSAGTTLPLQPNCHEPWRQPLIKYNGDVQPCCAAPDAVMGNLLEDSFQSIWNGSRFREFRRRVNSAKPPDVCRACDIRYRYVPSFKTIESLYVRRPPANR